MIKLENVSKFYYSKGVIAVGFSRVSLNFDIGEFVAITGESGSGKSTLLNVISGLDTYEEGEMYIDGGETSHYTEKDFEDYRRKYIGNIFQSFNLVNSYTVYQNIELVLLLNGLKGKDVKKRVNELIDRVGLSEYRHTKASKLSGGQKQRVAIARALAKDTPIIIADEPTGNLDSESAADIVKLLSEIAKDKLVIIVTHNYDQVEPYVTRKIKMHDGKVLEDAKFEKKAEKAEESVEAISTETAGSEKAEKTYKDIRPMSQLRLGVRNAFNIPVKFLLLVFVFLFITVSMVSELAIFKSEQHENGLAGWNFFFNNTSENRIVVKKTDGSAISDKDIEELKGLENVSSVEKQDLLVDTSMGFESTDKDKQTYFYGAIASIDKFTGKLDAGRMPEKDDEVVIVASKDNYDFVDGLEAILDQEYCRYGYAGLDTEHPLKVVGVKYFSDSDKEDVTVTSETIIYVSEPMLDDILFETNIQYSSQVVEYNGKRYSNSATADDVINMYPLFFVCPSDKVASGECVVSEQADALSPKGKAVGQDLTITVNNTYYNDSLKLKVSKTYSKRNYKTYYSGTEEFQYIDGFVYVSLEDYKQLFNKGTYQSSVFVIDPLKVDDMGAKLAGMGYTPLIVKNALYKDSSAVILKIMSYIVTAGLAVALFFISYFVIRIILKSRNVYYSTIRMLGANSSVARTLLILDLMTDANIAYAITLIAAKVLSIYFPKVYIIKSITMFMGPTEFLAIYLIVAAISLLISIRYANKLFKNSTIETYKEEV